MNNAEIEVEIKNMLSDKDYNEKQKSDWLRYFNENYKKTKNKEKAIGVAEIRFNHKYAFNKVHDRYGLKMNYIERKINKVNK